MHKTSTFQRKLKSSRQFVFENIMDLEHVCTLHSKWFRNLCLRVQRPDYVEYKLTSWFYGLRQELLVRGGPLDADHYWYEFLGAFAKIRVDGFLEGPDGDLTQTESITYTFHWSLTPIFWLLGPLFHRQKMDILTDDSALLERVYALHQSGFERCEPPLSKIVIYGGTGFFGRLVVEDLLKHSDARLVIASRRPDTTLFPEQRARIMFVESDLNDRGSVLEAIKDANIAIGCNGPFQGAAPTLLKACIENKVHYIDVADDRGFFERCMQLEPQISDAGIMAFVGCSAVPGLSSLLTQYCREHVPDIAKTRIFITPGTRHPRGPGSFFSLRSTVGSEFSVLTNGRLRKVRGWTGREQVCFPPPIGKRFVYFVVDIPDYLLQPSYFHTPTAEFKIGCELDTLNRSLELVRWTKESLRLKNLGWFAPIARVFISIAASFGTTRGALMVEVSGLKNGKSTTVSPPFLRHSEAR